MKCVFFPRQSDSPRCWQWMFHVVSSDMKLLANIYNTGTATFCITSTFLGQWSTDLVARPCQDKQELIPVAVTDLRINVFTNTLGKCPSRNTDRQCWSTTDCREIFYFIPPGCPFSLSTTRLKPRWVTDRSSVTCTGLQGYHLQADQKTSAGWFMTWNYF